MSDTDDDILTAAYPKASVKPTKATDESDLDAAEILAAYAKEPQKPLTKQELLKPMHTAPWLGQVTDQPKSTGGLEELAGGFGRGLVMGGMGVGQMIPGDVVTRADVQEQRDLSAGLMDTRMGRLGNLLGTGAFYAPLAYIPGANTGLGSAAIGGGVGLLAPSTSSTETAGNVFGGMIGGPLFNRVGAGLTANTGVASGGFSGIAPNLRQGAAHWASQPTNLSAASANGAAVSQASPELRQAYNQAVANGQTPKAEVLARHIEADTLPVPIRLTEGQATQNPDIVSREMNRRGQTGLSQVHNQQNAALNENLGHLRESVGPDVFTTNNTQHADTIIQAYKDRDAPIVADINARYQALNDAAGGEFPVDGQAFVANARAALKGKLKSEFVPDAIERQLKAFENGEPMTFEQFEAMRTNLANEMRDNSSGNARAAAGLVRQALEDLPLTGGAADLKPLADAARSAARARFASLEADPAYRAAIEGTVPPDRFIERFVTGGKRDNVATMRQHLEGNDQALQTLGVAAIDDLRAAAGIDPQGNGNFNQHRFNTRLTKQQELLPHLIPGGERDQLASLGNVARYLNFRPKGSYVNESNTLTGALAVGAASAALAAADAKTGGLASMGRKAFDLMNKGKELQQTTRPLAGAFEEPK